MCSSDLTTGKNRGLLCNGCNHALGEMKEDKRAILNSVLYLCEHEETPTELTAKLQEGVKNLMALFDSEELKGDLNTGAANHPGS